MPRYEILVRSCLSYLITQSFAGIHNTILNSKLFCSRRDGVKNKYLMEIICRRVNLSL